MITEAQLLTRSNLSVEGCEGIPVFQALEAALDPAANITRHADHRE